MLYHGTKQTPWKILKEGLKPINIDYELQLIRKKYNFNLPFNNEIKDCIQRKYKYLYVYLTDDFKYAYKYAKYGSNFLSNIEIEICNIIGTRWQPSNTGYIYVINLHGNGEIKLPYVDPLLIVDYKTIIFK